MLISKLGIIKTPLDHSKRAQLSFDRIMLHWLAVLFFLLLFIVVRDVKKPAKFPPGPAWLPVVGSLPLVKRWRTALGYHHLVWHALAARYGPVVGMRLGRDLVAIVSSVDGIRDVFNRDDFDGRPDGFFFRMRTFGKRLGIVFTDGHIWQKQRKFSLHHLKQFGYGRREMEEQITEEVQMLIASLEHRTSELVAIHTLFDVGVINVLWAMMAGKRFELDDSRLRQLLDIIHDAFRSTDISGGVLNQMPFLRFLVPDACGYTQHCGILERMWAFLRETITEHKESLCSAGHARDLIDAFLQKMSSSVDKTALVDPTFTDEQLLSLCLDMFMAGSETTSNTLEFIVLYLVRHPDVQQRMQQEMDEVVGRNRRPTLQDRNRLPYVEAVICEVQRCANVAPVGIAHRAVRDAELLGHQVPSGTIVLTNLYSLHTAPEFWGADSHKFSPERFLEKGAKQDEHFAPFGYGHRRCLGESLAKANLFLVTTALFHTFDVAVPLHCEPPSLLAHDGVTLSPKPFRVSLTLRN